MSGVSMDNVGIIYVQITDK